MLAFLSGTVHEKESQALLINVQGVGYRVLCPLDIIAQSKKGAEIFLYTHQHVREDDLSLFGFLKREELEFFEKLISVSGIGPKTALDILEVPSHLVHKALEESDVTFLKTLKGIGKKTAERMIVELRGNLPLPEEGSGQTIPAEVMQALTDLGFDRVQIQKTFREMKEPLSSSEEMVKWFLQKSAK